MGACLLLILLLIKYIFKIQELNLLLELNGVIQRILPRKMCLNSWYVKSYGYSNNIDQQIHLQFGESAQTYYRSNHGAMEAVCPWPLLYQSCDNHYSIPFL